MSPVQVTTWCKRVPTVERSAESQEARRGAGSNGPHGRRGCRPERRPGGGVRRAPGDAAQLLPAPEPRRSLRRRGPRAGGLRPLLRAFRRRAAGARERRRLPARDRSQRLSQRAARSPRGERRRRRAPLRRRREPGARSGARRAAGRPGGAGPALHGAHGRAAAAGADAVRRPRPVVRRGGPDARHQHRGRRAADRPGAHPPAARAPLRAGARRSPAPRLSRARRRAPGSRGANA